MGISLFFILFYNHSFYKHLLHVYPLNGVNNFLYLVSLTLLLFSVIVLLLTLFSGKRTIKFILITLLMVSSVSAYFMNCYNIIIDSEMIRNVIETDIKESLDLFNLKLIVYLFFLGMLPSFYIYTIKIRDESWRVALFRKIKTILLMVLIIVMVILSFSKFYTSFFREHKPLRYYTNPTYWIYSIGNHIAKTLNSRDTKIEPIGLDATLINQDGVPRLVIMVVGEATRADHLSLNGYPRETTPLLKKEKIINLPHVSSCGTSTAHSVPCMFSLYTRDNYSHKKGISTENVLDVLRHTHGIEILWRDNNSDSKGVALRVPFEDYTTPKHNPLCDEECRDEGMLVGLDSYIKEREGREILILLHQKGNHGPAYSKRYTKRFAKFTPACHTNQLEECSTESINNAYDNALLHTDYFLSEVIQLLKRHEKTYRTTMIYMSDHGESLGEHGIYLHGMPYFMAPEAQTHVGAFLWLGHNNQKEFDPNQHYSHDNLFHTLLGLFDVQTEVYNQEMDIFR